jgi:poly-gamma-glutamate capsule biosynthesis protein CapA/YwtB (metallophosphatase superfamily)
MLITLTGQSMIRGDTRADAPEAVPAIRSLLNGDVVFTNFEAAVFDPSASQTTRDGRFASPPQAMEALASFGFNLLAMPNNHSYDIKGSGIVNTVRTADRLGLTHAGIGRDMAEAERHAHLDTAKGTVALVAAASGLVHEARAAEGRPGVNELAVLGATPDAGDAQRLLERVSLAKKSGALVVASHHNHHYPGIEHPADFKQLLLSELPERMAPAPWLRPWAHALIEAGADIVAMHGPPFLHGMEVHRGKPIFYSLGNFFFQVPPESIHLEEPIMWESVVANVTFDGDRLAGARFTPIAMNKVGKGRPNPHDEFDVNEYHRTRGLPRRATGKQAQYLLERFSRLSAAFDTRITIDGEQAKLVLPRAKH